MTLTQSEKATINLVFLMKDYAAFNLWANKRLADWLITKPAGLFDQEVPSSFPSLRKTLYHIWTVEESWLGNLLGIEVESKYFSEFTGTPAELLEGVVNQSEELAYYVQSLDEKDLQEGCKFKAPVRWPEWDEFIHPRFQIIQHCITHSTYHRGNIITIARNLGLTDPPMTDYMSYLLIGKAGNF